MGWETRNGRSYYYRKERDGQRVRSVYVGTGETARLLAQFDALLKDERESKRIIARTEREPLEALEAELSGVSTLIETLTTGALLAAGFHKHKRQWRRTRHERENHSEDRRRED